MGEKDLPLDRGSRIYKVFEELGLVFRGRSEKNHYILTHPDRPNLYISIPDHSEVDRRLLKAEIRKAGFTDKQFRKKYDGH